ncbi:MAG: hypothetical protein MUO31_07535, partial [Thermodesulfovibrionales bacterium]|nr:hypothetical protein [Thermodesulfovibrionales bacterium]
RGFTRALKMDNISVTSRENSAFAATVIDPPDFKIREFDDALLRNKRDHSDLDVQAPRNGSGPELEASLLPSSRGKVEAAMSKLKALSGGALSVAGVTAVIWLGLNTYDALAKATNERMGCHVIRRENNTTTSCKISSRSCVNSDGSTCSDISNLPTDVRGLYNTTTYLIQLAIENDPTNVGASIGLGAPISTANVSGILANNAQFSAASALYYESDPLPVILNPCATVAGINGGNAPFCASCNSSANVTSPEYFEAELLADNISLLCVTNGSILDTLVDIGVGIGVDLLAPFSGFSNSLSGNLTFLIWLILIVFLTVLAAALYSRVAKPKKQQVQVVEPTTTRMPV